MTMENGNRRGSSAGLEVSLERFAELAGAYGADLERWPESERFAALALAGRSADARALLADAHAVDAALAGLDRPPAPSAALRARIASLEAGDAPPPPRLAGKASGRAAVFAMAAAAGIVLGLYLAPPGAGDAGLGLVEASLIAGDAPSIVVGDLLELD